ncbi:MAG: amino acid adenylation domain-containing protein [Flavobacteriales bacterium]|nr:amino acid adenylation domain-containing protein [Flavobacteriales bacterium]
MGGESILPLHYSQKDVFVDQALFPGAKYNIGGYIKLHGQLNLDLFTQAVKSAGEHFDAFSMRFDASESEPNIRIDAQFKEVDLTLRDFCYEDKPERSAETWLRENINEPFEISRNTKLFEHYLLKINDNTYWFYGKYHHLITDGYGFIIFVNYVASKYRSFINGELEKYNFPSFLAEIRNSEKYLHSDQFQADRDYWVKKIGKKPESLIAPNYNYSSIRFNQSTTKVYKLKEAELEMIQKTLERFNCSIQQLTLAALVVYFGKTTGQDKFVFGTPIHRRGSRVLRNIVGMFSGFIPFVGRYNPGQTTHELIKNVKICQASDYRHQYYPIGELSRDLQINALVESIFQISVNYEPLMFELDFGSQIEAEVIRLANEDENNPLQINWREYGDDKELEIHINYLKTYFSEYEIDLICKRILFILGQFDALSDQKVSEIQILNNKESEKLQEFNRTETEISYKQTFIDLFESQVESTPERSALVLKGETINYRELNSKANQLANYLIKNGVKPGMQIPLCTDRNFDMLVSILAILKAGCAYVPIDPDYPQERINFMIEDVNADRILCSSSRAGNCAYEKLDIIKVDALDSELSGHSSKNPKVKIAPDSVAYILYTSGSTGQPKGVVIGHDNLSAFLQWSLEEFKDTSYKVMYAGTSMCFDLSVFEMFYPLISGCEVRILESGLQSGVYLREDREVFINTVPTVMEYLFKEGTDLKNIRAINLAGEPMSRYLEQQLESSGKEVRNLYGPTEDTTYSTVYRFEKGKKLTIGRPISNTKVHIVGKDLNLLPIGVKGEICLSGAGVARGYLNREDLTKERFLKDPFSEKKGARMYKTGDLGRWTEEGEIEYLGRLDDQVKVRGYRIELGEIESAIEQTGLVNRSVVVVKNDSSNTSRLVGYVEKKKDYTKHKLQEILREHIPEYMIPRWWVEMEKLPLNPNGKIDKKSLPDPEAEGQLSGAFVAPKNPTEETLVEIWKEIMNLDKIGTKDNFFELGGTSLLAMKMVSRVNKQFKTGIKLKTIFEYQNISDLSNFIQFTSKENKDEILETFVI